MYPVTVARDGAKRHSYSRPMVDYSYSLIVYCNCICCVTLAVWSTLGGNTRGVLPLSDTCPPPASRHLRTPLGRWALQITPIMPALPPALPCPWGRFSMRTQHAIAWRLMVCWWCVNTRRHDQAFCKQGGRASRQIKIISNQCILLDVDLTCNSNTKIWKFIIQCILVICM